MIAVDNTRQADGVPTLQTDWWNYGGLTRDVSLVEVPESSSCTGLMHWSAATRTQIEGWVHVEGASAGTKVTVNIPGLEAW